MRKGMWSAAAIVVLLSGAPVLWGPNVQAADNRVEMVDLAFEPADIPVPVNTPVLFHNKSGSLPHDAKADNNSFSTRLLGPGEEQSVTVSGAPGDVITYFCSVEGHKSAGMKGTIRLVAAGSTPSPPATTPTTAATTTTTAKAVPGQPATTTTAKVAAGSAATTTTTAGTGVTATTQAPSVTPTSGPDTAAETTTTTAAGQSGEESAAADHGGEGGEAKKKEKNSPIGIAFAALSTLLLTAIAGKLLASKS